jgi:hypothetical protein
MRMFIPWRNSARESQDERLRAGVLLHRLFGITAEIQPKPPDDAPLDQGGRSDFEILEAMRRTFDADESDEADQQSRE